MKEQTLMPATHASLQEMQEWMEKTLETSKAYTLNVAKAMPSGGWTSKPADSIWNFGELIHHIAYGIQWWQENYVKGNPTSWDPPAVKENQNEVLTYLEKSYDELRKTINRTTLTVEMMKGFLATLDHITHHRGQAVIYLRYQGITPPEYTY
ncbi:MAG TPA: DinB family protein [Chitinophagaceae bacterium]|nr:DinB family protein [Chitinophagaceae bacterium]